MAICLTQLKPICRGLFSPTGGFGGPACTRWTQHPSTELQTSSPEVGVLRSSTHCHVFENIPLGTSLVFLGGQSEPVSKGALVTERGFSWPLTGGKRVLRRCPAAAGSRKHSCGEIVATPQLPLTREATRVQSSAKYTKEECSDEMNPALVVVSSAPRSD